MQKFFSKLTNNTVFYLKIFLLPFIAFFYILNNLMIHIFSINIIPIQEMSIIIFSLVLLINVYSTITYFEKVNFNLLSKYFNYWISTLFVFLGRAILFFLLIMIGYLTIQMIYLEFEFGTIFGAQSNWEFSWVFKIPFLFWIFLIGLYSITGLKKLVLPFSTESKK